MGVQFKLISIENSHLFTSFELKMLSSSCELIERILKLDFFYLKILVMLSNLQFFCAKTFRTVSFLRVEMELSHI